MLSTSESSRLAVGGQRQRCTRPSSYALGVKSFSNKCSGRRAPRCDVRRRSGRQSSVSTSIVFCKSFSGDAASPIRSEAGANESDQSAFITAPMEIKVEGFADLEQSPHPDWATFCGSVGGCWLGRYAAFSPAGGQAEPLTYDDAGNKVYELLTFTVEERDVDPEANVDRMVRRSITATNMEELKQSASIPDNPDWKESELGRKDGEIVTFYGGPYFAGPRSLLPDTLLGRTSDPDPEVANAEPLDADPLDASRKALEFLFQDEVDPTEPAIREARARRALKLTPVGSAEKEILEDESATVPSTADIGLDPPRKVSELEACVFWAGRTRLRVQVLLDVGLDENGALDVLPLRVAMLKEVWECKASDSVQQCNLEPDQPEPLLQSKRLAPATLTDRWATFDLIAVCNTEQDPETGEDRPAELYYARESQQEWSAGRALRDDQGGWTLRLPYGVMLELSSVRRVSRGAEADAAEGMIVKSSGEGLLLSVLWQIREGLFIGMQRQHNEDGELVEVRSITAKRGERSDKSVIPDLRSLE